MDQNKIWEYYWFDDFSKIDHIWWFLTKTQGCAAAHESDQIFHDFIYFFAKKKGFWKGSKWTALDPNSLTITHETPNYDGKNSTFSQKALCCWRAIVHACSSSLQCGTKKNYPTWKRKNKNRTINAEQKVLISVVVYRAV